LGQRIARCHILQTPSACFTAYAPASLASRTFCVYSWRCLASRIRPTAGMRKSNRKTKKSQSAKSGGQNRESQGNMIRSKPSKGPESKRGSACVVIFWAPTRLLAAQHTPMPGGGSTNCQKSKSRRIRFAGIPPGLGQRFVECAHYRGMLELSLAWLPTFVYLLQNPDSAGNCS
jgi:hypothetical protein